MHTPRRTLRALLAILVPLLVAACQAESHSAAADVPATDVRQIPESRKAQAPDIMMQAADRGRVIGSDSAPLRIMVVSDYQCDSCRTMFEQTVPALRAEYVETGRARLTWVHYPLRVHSGAVQAASAAMCASAQGKFWEASARLFSAQQSWAASPRQRAIIDSLAMLPGMTDYRFRNCVDGGRMLRQIRGDIDWTDTARAGAPPMIVIGARRLSGVAPLAVLRATIDSALAGK